MYRTQRYWQIKIDRREHFLHRTLDQPRHLSETINGPLYHFHGVNLFMDTSISTYEFDTDNVQMCISIITVSARTIKSLINYILCIHIISNT
jgi:hypothetical protein